MMEMDLFNLFSEEGKERIALIEGEIEELKKDPSSREIMNDIYRNFHTIKGMANFIELDIVSKMIDKTEKLLERHWEREINATEHFISLVLKTAELLKSICEDYDILNEEEFFRNLNSHYVYLNFIEEEIDRRGRILNSVSDGILTMSDECKVISCNRAAENITGFKKEEFVEKYCKDLFVDNYCKESCRLKITAKKDKNIEQEAIMKHKNGKNINVKVKYYPITDDLESLIGGMIIFRVHGTMLENIEEEFIFKSKPMEKINEMIGYASKVDSTILVTGETGTGKELVAKLIYERGSRKKSQMIKINCAAIPENLLESELFGHERGAFTGAVSNKKGYFEMADKGIIFLDEIGEINLTIQAKLLRVLQEGEFYKVGGKNPIKVDVKVIAATNKELKEEVKKGRFREDLYYRLNVFNIEIPPLRNRREEIPYLIESLIRKYNLKMNKMIKSISNEALELLMSYGFPGNVRELENILEYCFIKLDQGMISLEDLPGYIAGKNEVKEYIFSDDIIPLDEVERRYVSMVYEKLERNKLRTARELNIDVRRLRRILERWSIP